MWTTIHRGLSHFYYCGLLFGYLHRWVGNHGLEQEAAIISDLLVIVHFSNNRNNVEIR